MDLTTPALIAAVAAPLGAYLVAARQFSGRIESSDAKELWAESRSIRDWSQERITTLNQQVVRLETRIDQLEGGNRELSRENTALARENATLAEKVEHLKETLAECNAETGELRGQIEDLQARLAKSREKLEGEPDAA